MIFYQYCITNHSRNILNQNSNLMVELEFRKMIFGSEKDTSHSLQMKFLKFRQYLQKTSYIHYQRSRKRKSTGQYMNYQSFTNLQFKKLLKNSFHTIKIELKDTTGEKFPFVSVRITRVVLLFRKILDNHF